MQMASGASAGFAARRARMPAQIRRQRVQYDRSSSRVRHVGRADGRVAQRPQGTGVQRAAATGGATLGGGFTSGPPYLRRVRARVRQPTHRPTSLGWVPRTIRADGFSLPQSQHSPAAAAPSAKACRCLSASAFAAVLRQGLHRSWPRSATRWRHAQSAGSMPTLGGGVRSARPRFRRHFARFRHRAQRPMSLGCVERAPP